MRVIRMGDGTELLLVEQETRERFERDRARAEIAITLAAPRLVRGGREMPLEELERAVDHMVTIDLQGRWPGMLFGGIDVVSA